MSTMTHQPQANIADPNELSEHLAALGRYALKLTRNPAQADDLVQTCVERALSRLKQFQVGTNMKSWLFTIMHNEFISEVRRTARRGHQVELTDWQQNASTPQTQEKAVEMRDFEKAFNQLESSEQELLRLVSVEGKTYDELANMLGVEMGTVKSRLFRTREKLRKIEERMNEVTTPEQRECRAA